MKPLKIGISGVRGVVGETFTPELAVAFAQAFGTYLDGGPVIVGRDTRPSGPMVHAAVLSGLLAAGCEVIDAGICPTPTLQLAVAGLGARGGVSITAGHNPAHWNALKFVRGDGLYLSEAQADELLDIYHQGEFRKVGWREVATTIQTYDAIGPHLDLLRRTFDVEAIRRRRLTIAVDCCNGACARLSPRWLEALGCQVLAINDELGPSFPHDPEPRPETMAQVRAVVRAGRADAGFVHDADGERLGIVDGQARPLSEELTLPLAALARLERRCGPVVTNVSTSSAVERLAARYGASVVRTQVGQAYISEAILEHKAVLGGEGNGAVAVPEVHATHDAAAAIGLILEHLATTGESIAEMAGRLPAVAMDKRQVAVEPHLVYSSLRRFWSRAQVSGAKVEDLGDGVRLGWSDGWVHVRASNTESLIRIIAEADTARRAADLADWARDLLRP